MKTMTSVEAQNGFGRMLDVAQRETVVITRHGRPAAFVVSPRDMEDLLNSRSSRGQVVADLEAWRDKALSRTEEVQRAAPAPLTNEDMNRLVDELG
jgi:prevent-host-death family protein